VLLSIIPAMRSVSWNPARCQSGRKVAAASCRSTDGKADVESGIQMVGSGKGAGLAFPRRLIWASDLAAAFRNPWIHC
jgi:hypothetical protein